MSLSSVCCVEHLQTVAVAKEGPSVEDKKAWLLKVVCEITVLPGNPTKSSLEGDDWDGVSYILVFFVRIIFENIFFRRLVVTICMHY